MLNDYDEAELERRLQNWARWHAGGGGDGRGVMVGGSRGVSSIYAQRPLGRRSGYRVASVPVLVLDAQEVERATHRLDVEFGDALTAWYRRRGPAPSYQRFDATWTQEEIAAALGCSRSTFGRRLAVARVRLWEDLINRQ